MIKNFNFKKIKNVKGIIFDLDGTLTKPVMDFRQLKLNLGLESNVDVLQVITEYSEEEREKANKIIYDFELDARNKLVIQDHVMEFLKYLQDNNIPKAIHSRNSKENIKYFTELVKPYSFDHIVGREITPPKPHPSGSHDILRVFNENNSSIQLQPNEILFIGDSIDDLKTSRSFNSISCLLVNDQNKHHIPHADIYVDNFKELLEIFNNNK